MKSAPLRGIGSIALVIGMVFGLMAPAASAQVPLESVPDLPADTSPAWGNVWTGSYNDSCYSGRGYELNLQVFGRPPTGWGLGNTLLLCGPLTSGACTQTLQLTGSGGTGQLSTYFGTWSISDVTWNSIGPVAHLEGIMHPPQGSTAPPKRLDVTLLSSSPGTYCMTGFPQWSVGSVAWHDLV